MNVIDNNHRWGTCAISPGSPSFLSHNKPSKNEKLQNPTTAHPQRLVRGGSAVGGSDEAEVQIATRWTQAPAAWLLPATVAGAYHYNNNKTGLLPGS